MPVDMFVVACVCVCVCVCRVADGRNAVQRALFRLLSRKLAGAKHQRAARVR